MSLLNFFQLCDLFKGMNLHWPQPVKDFIENVLSIFNFNIHMFHVHPECQLGVSFLTRVMSCPTKEAFKGVLHMIAYLYGQRHRGIRMRGERGAQLRAHCDASNNPDRSDKCKAQGGYIIFLGDSPVCWGSKKVSHVGQSAQHNEMMQIAVCSKAVTWIRFLLEEIGFTCHIIGPTVIENDNLGAVKLCRDDILTPANCYYDKDIFFAKEAFEREITWLDSIGVRSKDAARCAVRYCSLTLAAQG